MLSKSGTDERLPTRYLNEFKKPDCSVEVLRNEIEKECFIKERLCPVTKSNCSRQIISHENLSGLTRSVTTGNEIAYNLKNCYPTAKILIIIRNQWDALESLYTHRISNKGVEWRSFSTFIEQTVANPENIAKWRYLELVKLYLRLFGRNNVLILPLEMLETSPQEFLNRISTFHCDQSRSCSLIQHDDDAENDNRSVKNRNIHLILRVFNFINMRVTRFIRLTLRCPRLGYSIRNRYSHFLQYTIQPALLQTFPGGYCLSEKEKLLKEQIRDLYAASNKELSTITGVELSDLGYYDDKQIA